MRALSARDSSTASVGGALALGVGRSLDGESDLLERLGRAVGILLEALGEGERPLGALCSSSSSYLYCGLGTRGGGGGDDPGRRAGYG